MPSISRGHQLQRKGDSSGLDNIFDGAHYRTTGVILGTISTPVIVMQMSVFYGCLKLSF